MPALLMSTSSRPNRDWASSTTSAAVASSAMSAASPATSMPSARNSSRAGPRSSSSTGAQTTTSFAPSPPSRLATARPMPLLAPLTTATLPANRFTPDVASQDLAPQVLVDAGIDDCPHLAKHPVILEPARRAELRVPGLERGEVLDPPDHHVRRSRPKAPRPADHHHQLVVRMLRRPTLVRRADRVLELLLGDALVLLDELDVVHEPPPVSQVWPGASSSVLPALASWRRVAAACNIARG